VRRLILAILLAGSVATFVRLPSVDGRSGFDPLEPRGREVERAIAAREFEAARPIAEQLAAIYPETPIAAIWLAEIYRGLGRASDEARAWETVLSTTGVPDEACPALPEAYRRAGDTSRALDAFKRCAAAAPDDPERLVDLADAYAAAGLASDAVESLRRVALVDPSHPRVHDAVGTEVGTAPGATP
jgi:tetratricopeptide (TPR) repeat protein